MLDMAEYGSVGRSATLSPSWKKADNPLSRPVPDEVRSDRESVVGLSLAGCRLGAGRPDEADALPDEPIVDEAALEAALGNR